ncbi:MAG: bifunctional 3,4-dihydroxy-2-butanone-4-phosphate synthase/GTP cyclohydrolase II [Elusimicrobia bacterium]|nr:bifunctional 3,4-dihydroxy-2-butanone-4-phosphate synthase/GTP cyclohydrolase II [Elusimicrobiota bacterium]
MINKNVFASVEGAVKDIKAGKMVIVIDEPERENEGDLCCAAQKITPRIINFMSSYGRGLICVPMKRDMLKKLSIGDMTAAASEKKGCAFTVSVDGKEGTSTGISAGDRALTIKKLINLRSKPDDFTRPGHVFPLAYREGGVLARAGHTEAAVDLAELAGLSPAGVICEIMKKDGNMARTPDLIKFSKKHKLKIVTIADIIQLRRKKEKFVREVTTVDFPTEFGHFKLKLFEDILHGDTALAIIKGDIKNGRGVLARVHSSCETGDIFHSRRCDCGAQLKAAMQKIEDAGRGFVLYLHQEGRGIGLANKLRAYHLQEHGLDTVQANEALGFPADLRDYGTGAQIINALGVKSIKLMTNNPKKLAGLTGYGFKIDCRVPLEIKPVKENKKYLKTKKSKLGHLLHI